MKKHILFFQGGGGKKDHKADAGMVDSLQAHLGANYQVHYPLLDNDDTPDFGRMQQIANEISAYKPPLILVGHSLGASMLLRYLSEYEVTEEIAAVFLISTPHWNGSEDWVKPLKLTPGFEKKLDTNIPMFFYHCKDDEVVSVDQLEFYKKKLPRATFREIPSGGHQLGDDASVIAKDIQAL